MQCSLVPCIVVVSLCNAVYCHVLLLYHSAMQFSAMYCCCITMQCSLVPCIVVVSLCNAVYCHVLLLYHSAMQFNVMYRYCIASCTAVHAIIT